MSEHVRIHEAGHTGALLARGFAPNYIRAGHGGGVMQPWEADAETRAIVCMAGAAAERLLLPGRSDAQPSEGDERHLAEAAVEAGRDSVELRAWATSEAELIVSRHSDAVRALAEVLPDHGVMRRIDLRRLCGRPGPLSRFHHLGVRP
jgi:hypothetical protein